MGNSNEGVKIGYRIFSIKNDGPMSEVALKPLIDFIVFQNDEISLEEAIKSNSILELSIYNIATRSMRKVTVEPQILNEKTYLGISVRPEDYSSAHVRVIHVLSFMEGSPLEKAGFIPNTDYILGTEQQTFNCLDDFEMFIKRNDGKFINLFVYNSDTDGVREIRTKPNSSWGGGGCLGGDFGFGSFHAIPKKVPLKKESDSDVKEDEDKKVQLENNDTVKSQQPSTELH